MKKSFFCVLDFNRTEEVQPQGAIASAFREVVSQNDCVEYNSLLTSKEDMIGEYSERKVTTSAVRLEIRGLEFNRDEDFSLWIDKKMNAVLDDSVYGVEIN
jgi:hypothetical protein